MDQLILDEADDGSIAAPEDVAQNVDAAAAGDRRAHSQSEVVHEG